MRVVRTFRSAVASSDVDGVREYCGVVTLVADDEREPVAWIRVAFEEHSTVIRDIGRADRFAVSDPCQLLLRRTNDVRAGMASKHVQDGTPVKVAATGKGVELTGSLATASTLTENLLLEYTNGFEGRDLGWGRLDRDTLVRVLQLHTTYADLVRRTAYIARTRGSNLLAHILVSMQQAAVGRPLPGALGSPGDKLLVISGHDTNQSNISGMLGLSWQLPGYQPDDTPPGGALVLSLWRAQATGNYFVRAQYVAQSLEQMREATRLTLVSPPEQQDLLMPGCPRESLTAGCPLPTVEHALQQAIDPNATSIRGLASQIR